MNLINIVRCVIYAKIMFLVSDSRQKYVPTKYLLLIDLLLIHFFLN